MMNRLMCAASVSAAMAIAVAAFGAHTASGKAAEWLATGGSYQLIPKLDELDSSSPTARPELVEGLSFLSTVLGEVRTVLRQAQDKRG